MSRRIFPKIEAVLLVAGLVCVASALWAVSERVWFQWRYEDLKRSPDGPLGRIEIPRVGVAAVILEGVDGRTLRRGVGHVPGTALPGGPGGRIALAAHRDTFFRNLRLVGVGDIILLMVPGRTAIYRVESTSVVKPWRTDVIRPVNDDVLTLLTCFPFRYVGAAPDRFVVQARRAWPGLSMPDRTLRTQP